MNRTMPSFDTDNLRNTLSADDFAIYQGIISTQGKNKGCLRAAKPKVTDLQSAKVAYVWRMVAFQVSPIGQHHCLPFGADFDLRTEYFVPGIPAYGQPGYRELTDQAWALRGALLKELDALADKIAKGVPAIGIMRWGRALGAF